MDKHQSKIVILACLLILVVIVFFVPGTREQSPSISPYIPPPVNAEAPQLTNVGSPDGKLTLTMKEEKENDTTKHTFSITDSSGGPQKEIFVKAVPLASVLSIPYNTFSPDNKYIFLKEEDSGQTDYFVLATSGASIAPNIKTLDISNLFMAKYANFKITDVTGWGGTGLVVVNTNKQDGSLGPSFWFDVTSRSFIQLSTRFN